LEDASEQEHVNLTVLSPVGLKSLTLRNAMWNMKYMLLTRWSSVVRHRAVRRRRKVARKLKTCLYIRAWVRSVIPPESLRVELDDDGEMYVDKPTNCLVDNKLREFFKLHCFNLQSIAEYQDLAKVVVFYTNEELGMAELLEARPKKCAPR
jgi:hypothetical protein